MTLYISRRQIVQGNPLDPATMIGAQSSAQQLEKISGYVDIGRQEGGEEDSEGVRAGEHGDFVDESRVCRGARWRGRLVSGLVGRR